MTFHVMMVAGHERPNLRTLFLPKNSVDTATFSLLLSNSPQLDSIKIDGELLGANHIQISHPTLRTIEIECQKPRPLTVHCPNLTHLSTIYDAHYIIDEEAETSLFCPLLTDLSSSEIHSAPSVLVFMFTHAPNSERLEVIARGRIR